MIAIVVGFVRGADRAGPLLVVGFALITLAGIELALREHRNGYRSHSTLLAGVTAVAVAAPLYLLTGVPGEVLLIVGVAVFAAAFGGLRRWFAQASGGLGFRA